MIKLTSNYHNQHNVYSYIFKISILLPKYFQSLNAVIQSKVWIMATIQLALINLWSEGELSNVKTHEYSVKLSMVHLKTVVIKAEQDFCIVKNVILQFYIYLVSKIRLGYPLELHNKISKKETLNASTIAYNYKHITFLFFLIRKTLV